VTLHIVYGKLHAVRPTRRADGAWRSVASIAVTRETMMFLRGQSENHQPVRAPIMEAFASVPDDEWDGTAAMLAADLDAYGVAFVTLDGERLEPGSIRVAA